MTVSTAPGAGPGAQSQGTPPAGQGQEPPATGQQGQEPPAQTDPPNGSFDLEQIQDPALKAYLTKVQADAHAARQEAARYRTERNTLQAEQQRANESAQERAEREQAERDERIQKLEQENRDLKVGTAIAAAAKQANAWNPERVAQELAGKVDLGEDGQPTNVAELLAELRRTDPYMFRRTDNNGGDGANDPPTPGNMNDTIRAQIAARRGRA